jgi:hypothetical protein
MESPQLRFPGLFSLTGDDRQFIYGNTPAACVNKGCFFRRGAEQGEGAVEQAGKTIDRALEKAGEQGGRALERAGEKMQEYGEKPRETPPDKPAPARL